MQLCDDTHKHILEKEKLAQLALEAMLEGMELADQKFYNKRDYPGTPLYLRKSSVEERLAVLKDCNCKEYKDLKLVIEGKKESKY